MTERPGNGNELQAREAKNQTCKSYWLNRKEKESKVNIGNIDIAQFLHARRKLLVTASTRSSSLVN